jgi:uncharacterized protein GlcG (DUF336 family)
VKIISIALQKSKEMSIPISIAVVDSQTTLVGFVKTDGSTFHSAITSKKKAVTAASTKKQTGWMNENLSISLPMAADNILTNIYGGFPVMIDNKVIGAFGISGGTVEQDKVIGEYVLEEIQIILKKSEK